MQNLTSYMRKGLSFKFRDLPLFWEDYKNRKANWYTIFPHSGLLVFCGSQGMGKTTSMIDYLYNILQDYPRARVVTNVDLCLVGFPNEFVRFNDIDDLQRFGNNGLDGVIFVIDEIHLLWNNLESKSITPMEMIEFAQNRKQRRLILGTSQRLMRIAKPIREQLKWVVNCKNYFGILQRNELVDMDEAIESINGDIEIKSAKTMWWFHDYVVRISYDTYQKMRRIGGTKWRK